MSDALAWLFAGGHAADIVLAVMLVEGVWLVARRSLSVPDVLALLLPGALMVIALRAALTGTDWRWVATPLLLSLPVHLIDVARRHVGRRDISGR